MAGLNTAKHPVLLQGLARPMFGTHIVTTSAMSNLAKGDVVRSFLLLTETGPVLLLTKCSSVTESSLVAHLDNRGIQKFIAFEVPVSKVHKLYGVPFEVVAADIDLGRDMGILDYNGGHIFSNFSFDELGTPTLFEH